MSVTLDQQKQLLAKKSTFSKIMAALKKFFAKQFLWALFVALVSIPLALIANFLISHYAPELLPTIASITGNGSSLVGIYILCLVGLYFSRMVANAIKTLAKKAQKK